MSAVARAICRPAFSSKALTWWKGSCTTVMVIVAIFVTLIGRMVWSGLNWGRFFFYWSSKTPSFGFTKFVPKGFSFTKSWFAILLAPARKKRKHKQLKNLDWKCIFGDFNSLKIFHYHNWDLTKWILTFHHENDITKVFYFHFSPQETKTLRGNAKSLCHLDFYVKSKLARCSCQKMKF